LWELLPPLLTNHPVRKARVIHLLHKQIADPGPSSSTVAPQIFKES
jgi:hypothetical protein